MRELIFDITVWLFILALSNFIFEVYKWRKKR